MSAPSSVARVAVFDAHPAVRIGLEAMLTAAPGLSSAGSAGAEAALWPLLRESRPETLVLDVDHPDVDGMRLAWRITSAPDAPQVVVHTLRRAEDVGVAAMLVGAVAVVEKSADPLLVLDLLRQQPVAALRGVSRPARLRAAELTDPSDHAILAMRLARTPVEDIAATLRQPPAVVERRTLAMLGRLRRAQGPGLAAPA